MASDTHSDTLIGLLSYGSESYMVVAKWQQETVRFNELSPESIIRDTLVGHIKDFPNHQLVAGRVFEVNFPGFKVPMVVSYPMPGHYAKVPPELRSWGAPAKNEFYDLIGLIKECEG